GSGVHPDGMGHAPVASSCVSRPQFPFGGCEMGCRRSSKPLARRTELRGDGAHLGSIPSRLPPELSLHCARCPPGYRARRCAAGGRDAIHPDRVPNRMKLEHCDTRVLGAIRWVDAVTRTAITQPLAARSSTAILARNHRGLSVIRSALGLEKYRRVFVLGDLPAADVKADESVTVQGEVRDPSGAYLP